jgi:hypothetical protein
VRRQGTGNGYWLVLSAWLELLIKLLVNRDIVTSEIDIRYMVVIIDWVGLIV